jgi:hypothetical protein
MRAARLALLLREYRRHHGSPDDRAALVGWAIHSTLADCVQLGIGPEARALLAGSDE